MTDKIHFLDNLIRISDYLDNLDNFGSGPFPGAGINGRYHRLINNLKHSLGREVKGYKHSGTLGYMIRFNLILYDLTNNFFFLERVIRDSDELTQAQQKGGYWLYDLEDGMPGRIHTIDGCEAARALFLSYKRTQKKEYLVAYRKWCALLIKEGLKKDENGHFFFSYYIKADNQKVTFPNEEKNISVNIAVIDTLYHSKTEYGELYSLISRDLINLINYSQLSSGEFIYTSIRKYYQQPQYNAFEYLWLENYQSNSDNEEVIPILQKNFKYLCTKVRPDGSVPSEYPFGLNRNKRYTFYHSSVLAAALSKPITNNLNENPISKIKKCFNYVFSNQNSDGSFPYSKKGLFGIFDDNLRYPYKIAMIGYLLSFSYKNIEVHLN